jgi:negative regulator of sigma E activity
MQRMRQPLRLRCQKRGLAVAHPQRRPVPNYQGTMVFSSAAALSSSRVWHYCVGDQTYERMEALDGRQQHIVRHNDAVHTLWPQSRVAVVEKRETLAAWSTTPQRWTRRRWSNTNCAAKGMARVAGRDAPWSCCWSRATRCATPSAVGRPATGLMLRADVIGQTSGATGAVRCSNRPRFLSRDRCRPQPEPCCSHARKH